MRKLFESVFSGSGFRRASYLTTCSPPDATAPGVGREFMLLGVEDDRGGIRLSLRPVKFASANTLRYSTATLLVQEEMNPLQSYPRAITAHE